MAADVPDPLQKKNMEIIIGLVQADQDNADVRSEIVERTRQGFTVVGSAIMMHQQQVMNMVTFDGKIKELENKVNESENSSRTIHEDATRRMNVFQEHGNQLSAKVDTAPWSPNKLAKVTRKSN